MTKKELAAKLIADNLLPFGCEIDFRIAKLNALIYLNEVKELIIKQQFKL